MKWVGFGKLIQPMQSSEETLPARKSAAIRKLFGFLTVHLAHCQGSQLQCSLMHRTDFLKMWGWASTTIWDLSLQPGDITASWTLEEEPANSGSCFSHAPQIASQWWSLSFSLKYRNTMTVIVKSMWTKLLPTNLCSFIKKASLQFYWQNKQTKMNTQNEGTSAKACSRGGVGI